ncbi:hypothetical protein QR680_018883 [Steinernema hermaphroditum]|uniref:Uncharacterized protein n=1 Tax=Steinernema hermaphroditum TaxID=289476 RepID=A0AA39LRS2_9BILA|nr:hypothetical protein QR680_018883 [Steinernema hermaphroditum]
MERLRPNGTPRSSSSRPIINRYITPITSESTSLGGIAFLDELPHQRGEETFVPPPRLPRAVKSELKMDIMGRMKIPVRSPTPPPNGRRPRARSIVTTPKYHQHDPPPVGVAHSKLWREMRKKEGRGTRKKEGKGTRKKKKSETSTEEDSDSDYDPGKERNASSSGQTRVKKAPRKPPAKRAPRMASAKRAPRKANKAAAELVTPEAPDLDDPRVANLEAARYLRRRRLQDERGEESPDPDEVESEPCSD